MTAETFGILTDCPECGRVGPMIVMAVKPESIPPTLRCCWESCATEFQFGDRAPARAS